jgi:catechol 2,3-dioxygenase-like lactoylglutathione lyase family enzyme
MSKVNVKRVFHTGICVEDLDWSVGYFCGVLGFELMDRSPREPKNQSFVTGCPGAEVEIAYVKGPDHRLELLCYSAPDDRKTYTPRMIDVGSVHLCLVVDDVMQAAAASQAYDKRITTLSPEPLTVDNGPNKGNQIIFVKLPDGCMIEFTTRKNS